jgi:hypothetical protein
MARWRKSESMRRALAREAGSISKGVGKELLSIATLGLFRPNRSGSRAFRSPKSKGWKRR